MKIETLCSLATIGVVFAEPILSRQDSPSIQSIEQCMTNELETSVDEMCASTTSAACPHLRELQSCLTHAVYTVSTKTGLTPKEAAGYLTKCVSNNKVGYLKELHH